MATWKEYMNRAMNEVNEINEDEDKEINEIIKEVLGYDFLIEAKSKSGLKMSDSDKSKLINWAKEIKRLNKEIKTNLSRISSGMHGGSQLDRLKDEVEDDRKEKKRIQSKIRDIGADKYVERDDI